MGKGTENRQEDENFNRNILEDYLREVARNITYWREKRNLTQAEFRKQLEKYLGRNISSSTMSRYMNLERLIPLDVFIASLIVLQVLPNDLLPKGLIINDATQNILKIKHMYKKLNNDNKYYILELMELMISRQGS